MSDYARADDAHVSELRTEPDEMLRSAVRRSGAQRMATDVEQSLDDDAGAEL